MVDWNQYLKPLRYVGCNLCGADDTRVIHDRDRFGLNINSVICNSCGLIYLNPRPTDDNYSAMYEADYRNAVSGTEEWLEKRFDREVRMTDDLILPFFSEYRRGEIRSILDIGCGQGGLLSAFGREFPDVKLHGIEPGIKVAEFARYHTGADIRVGILNPGIFTDRFDLITITRSLNHFSDPTKALQLIRSMLNPGGSLLLNVLDAVSSLIIMEFDRMAEILHPYAFTRETILALVQRACFNVIGCQSTSYDTTKLTKKEMMSPSFRRPQEIQILVQPDVRVEVNPNVEPILNRINTNIRFYQKHRDVMFTGSNIGMARKKLGRWKRTFARGWQRFKV